MKIDYADIVLLNAELKRRDTRYHVSYKDENTVCIEPPGECCLTDVRKMNAMKCIEEYYRQKILEFISRKTDCILLVSKRYERLFIYGA